MRYFFIFFILAMTTLFLGCQSSTNRNNAKALKISALSESIDEYFRGIPNFSGNVLIAQNGDVLFSKSYGYSDREFKILNDRDTKFKIGSITKPITAMAVLNLVEKGKLSLIDSVGQFLSDIPTHWQSLTIHQLLTHTSGLIHTWDVLEDSILMFRKENFRNTLEWYSEKPLQFEPGTSFYYSGVGYLLLAAIIESVTNTTYDQHLRNVIFEPLNMKDTGASDPEEIIQKIARGYAIDSTGVRNAPNFYVPLLTGGGHLYSTTHDLLKLDSALSDYSILSKEMTRNMYTPVLENYGYGWDIVKNDTLNMVFHTGYIPGYLSRIDKYLDHDLTLIILTNYHSDWSPTDSWDITNLIFEGLQLRNN